MQKNNDENNKIKDASWVEELIEGMNKLDLESTLGQRQFYNDYNEATNMVFENPKIVNDNPEILKKMIKLSLQTEFPKFYFGEILESLGDKIEPDIWIDVFSEEELFEKMSDKLLQNNYYSYVEAKFDKVCLRLVDYAIEIIKKNNNNDGKDNNESNKKNKDFLKNIYGIYGYKRAKREFYFKSFALELLKRVDKIRDVLFEDENTRNRLDDICECIIDEYSDRDEMMPDYFYEYLGNRIQEKGYDLNSLLFLLSKSIVEFIIANKGNEKYQNLRKSYAERIKSKTLKINNLDMEEDIQKLDLRNTKNV